MLYHYYMKINLKLFAAGLFVLCFFPGAYAQVVVVKQEDKKVYLDISEYNRTVSIGNSFKVITSQEKLVNPKTGKDLGLLNYYSPVGKIIEVHDMYAIGELPTSTKVSIGQEALIEQANTPVTVPDSTPHAAAGAAAPATTSNRKVITYDAVERKLISAVQDDLTAHPGQEIAAVDTEGNIILYTVNGTSLQELAIYRLPSGMKPLTLSALDKMHTGHAQLFAAVYKEKDPKISTLVFDVQDAAFKKVAVLPYFVKELGCAEEKQLYAQRAFVHAARPGDAHELEYENGKFVLDDDHFATRGNWLVGTHQYSIQHKDADNFIYTASNGRLRMRLKNGKYVDSPALFATAPNRVKYKQKIVSFYPSLQVYGPEGRATVAAIQNTAKLGLLSEQFGQYSGGKLHFLTFNNGVFSVQETLPLNGFAYDTNCTLRGILVPQVLSGEQTVLTEVYR